MDATGGSPKEETGGALRAAGDAAAEAEAGRQPEQFAGAGSNAHAIEGSLGGSLGFGGPAGYGDMAQMQMEQWMAWAPMGDDPGLQPMGAPGQDPKKSLQFDMPPEFSWGTLGGMYSMPMDTQYSYGQAPSLTLPNQIETKDITPFAKPTDMEVAQYRLDSAKDHVRTKEEFNFLDENKDGIITMDEFLNQKQNWAEAELETIKVQTMQRMVTPVTYTVGDQQGTCQMLYLSNKQAASIPIANMEKVREVLDIKDPKLVIRLMPSRFGKTYWQAFPNWEERFPTKSRSEISLEDAKRVDHQLMLLAKEVLLPLAMRTNALIIGTESCSLAATFAQACEPVQRLMGDKCPFRMILFTRAYFLHLSSEMPGKTASAFRQASKQWSDQDFEGPLKNRFGDDPAFWPHEDLLPGCSQAVVFECLTDGKINPSTADRFQTDFVSSLAQFLPVIALQTQGEERMNLTPALADHVNRGLPLMLLDSRKRSTKPSDLRGVMEELGKVREELHRDGKMDMHTTSVLTFVKSMMVRRMAKKNGQDEQTERKEKDMWLWEAIDAKRAQSQKMEKRERERVRALELGKDRASTPKDERAGSPSSQPSIERVKSSCMTASERADKDALGEQDLVDAVNAVMEYAGLEHEWEAGQLEMRCQRAIDAVDMSASWEELKKNWEEHWPAIRGCAFHKYDALYAFDEKHPWCKMTDFGKDTPKGRYMLTIHPPGQRGHGGGGIMDHREAVDELLGAVKKDFNFVKGLHKKTKTLKAFMNQEEKWLSVYDIMKENNVRCGNIHNIHGCKTPIDSMAHIDRLPVENTLEAMILLRNAWALRDVFAITADWYKRATKIAYMVFWLLSTAIVITSSLSVLYPEIIDKQLLQHLLLGFALVSSFAAGWTTYLDPSKKWIILRGGSLELESEIWRFRTRISEYGASAGSLSTLGRVEAEHEAEKYFQMAIVLVRDRVLESASLKETSFYAIPTATDDIYVDIDTMGREPRARPKGVSGCCARCRRCFCCCWRRSDSKRLTKAYIKHGQYEGGSLSWKPGPFEDNFHSPTRPDAYVRWRLIPVMQFYQKRIPSYSRRRVLFQAALMCSSILSTLLAAVGKSRWTSIVAALAAALATWQEFAGVSKKLGRYSSTCESLGKLLLWWQSLGEVEQNNLKHIEALVNGVEDLAANESASWLSTVQNSLKDLVKLDAENKKKD